MLKFLILFKNNTFQLTTDVTIDSLLHLNDGSHTAKFTEVEPNKKTVNLLTIVKTENVITVYRKGEPTYAVWQCIKLNDSDYRILEVSLKRMDDRGIRYMFNLLFQTHINNR